MAGRTHLSARAPRARIAVIAAAVLVLHAVIVDYAASALGMGSILRPMAKPMFTRLLQPTQPAPIAAAPAAPAPPSHRLGTTVTQVAPKPRTAASHAAPARKHKRPERAPAAPAPVVTASAARPQPSASAPESPLASASASTPPATPASATSATSASMQDGEQAAPTAVANTGMPAAPAAPAASAPASSAPALAQAASAPASTASGPAVAARTPASASTAPALDTWPADTRLSYRLTGWYGGDLHGSARVQWQREGTHYQTQVVIDLTIVHFTFTSQGEVTSQGLSPIAYEEVLGRRTRNVRFSATGVTIHDGRVIPRPPGVQDTVSQLVDLSHRFATGQDALTPGGTVNFWLARPGGVDLWTYDIVAKEMLRTEKFGPLEAYHLRPRPITSPRGNITMEIWVAPTLQYLPVRVRMAMGDTAYVDLMVDYIEQR